MHQSEPFGAHLDAEKIDAGQIAARMIKARDQAHRDGVFSHANHDRDRCYG